MIPAGLTPSYSIRVGWGTLIEREKNMLMNLKDIQELTGYTNITTAYIMLRAAGVDPVEYRKIDGRGAPVNWYQKEDVLPVFVERLEKIGKHTV